MGGPCPAREPTGYSKLSKKSRSPRTVDLPNDSVIARTQPATTRHMIDRHRVVFVFRD